MTSKQLSWSGKSSSRTRGLCRCQASTAGFAPPSSSSSPWYSPCSVMNQRGLSSFSVGADIQGRSDNAQISTAWRLT